MTQCWQCDSKSPFDAKSIESQCGHCMREARIEFVRFDVSPGNVFRYLEIAERVCEQDRAYQRIADLMIQHPLESWTLRRDQLNRVRPLILTRTVDIDRNKRLDAEAEELRRLGEAKRVRSEEQRKSKERKFFSSVRDVRQERWNATKRSEDAARAKQAEEHRLALEQLARASEQQRELWRLNELRQRRKQWLDSHINEEDCWSQVKYPEPASLAPVDNFYASETYVIRRAALSNRAYGWLRPNINRWAEGFSR